MLSKRIPDKITDFALAVLLSYSLVYALESSLHIDCDRLGLLGIVSVAMLVYYVIFIKKLTSIITASVLGAGILLSAGIITLNSLWGRVTYFIGDYFNWLTEFILYPVNYERLYVLITLLFLSAIMTLLVYIFAVRFFVYQVVLAAGAALFFIQWIYNYVSGFTPFYIFVFTIIMYYFKYVYRSRFLNGDNNYVNSSALLLSLLPVCAIVVLISSVLRVSDKPVEWKWMDDRVNAVVDYFEQKYSNSVFNYYGFSSGGFSINNGKLGGQVNSDNTPVLKVKTSKYTYLKGVVKDIYTGTSWLESQPAKLLSVYSNENIRNNFMDSLAINLVAGPFQRTLPEYCTEARMTIKYVNMKTRTIFVPLNYSSIYKDESTTSFLDGLYSTDNGSLFLKSRQSKGYTYSVSAYMFDFSNSQLNTILMECGPDYMKNIEAANPKLYKEAKVPFYTPDGKAISVDLSEYGTSSEAIYNKYLKLPDSVPQRVKDLAISVTSKYTTQYDKAKALEKFLSTNFPYTLKTRSLPHKRDFVDYFLFDQRKGYCTYFASAMAVMARCVGIPSRYVEGYMLPGAPDKDGYYTVTNKNAHAWVEIYLEGFGWVAFEPTSSFTQSFYSSSQQVSAEVETSTSGSGYDYGEEEYKKMLEKYRKNGMPQDVGINLETTTAETDGRIKYILAFAFAGLLILSFISVNIINLVRHRMRIYDIWNKSPRESILAAYKYYLELLGLQELQIKPGETPYTFSKRVDSNFMFYNTRFKKVSQLFVKAQYSNLGVSENEKKEVYDFHNKLLGETMQNMGRLKFYLYKNILGRI